MGTDDRLCLVARCGCGYVHYRLVPGDFVWPLDTVHATYGTRYPGADCDENPLTSEMKAGEFGVVVCTETLDNIHDEVLVASGQMGEAGGLGWFTVRSLRVLR